MTAAVDLGDSDAMVFPDDPIAPQSDPVCQVCSTPLEWSGKGFRPKYCADHKRGKSRPAAGEKATTAPKTSTASRNASQVNRAIDSLRLLYSMGGAALNRTVAPKIGAAVYTDADKLAESYRMLLETNKQVRDWFAQAEGKAAWLPILVVHADLVMKIALDSGAVAPPDPASEPTAETLYWGTGDIPPRPDGA